MFYVYYNICFNINWFLLKIPSKIDTLPPSKIQSLVYWLLFNAFTNIWVCCTEQHALKENLQSSVLIKNPTPKAGCQGPGQGQPSPGAWLVIVISYQNNRWQMQFYTFWMYKRGWRDAKMIQIQDRGQEKVEQIYELNGEVGGIRKMNEMIHMRRALNSSAEWPAASCVVCAIADCDPSTHSNVPVSTTPDIYTTTPPTWYSPAKERHIILVNVN